jgi:hypothetical protein
MVFTVNIGDQYQDTHQHFICEIVEFDGWMVGAKLIELGTYNAVNLGHVFHDPLDVVEHQFAMGKWVWIKRVGEPKQPSVCDATWEATPTPTITQTPEAPTTEVSFVCKKRYYGINPCTCGSCS